MGRAVVADEPGAVHREDDVQLLQADVVDDLVEGALQEGRVDRADGLRALEREAGGEEDGVLLGDADVVVLLGTALASLSRPVPPAIAAVIPITRGSRLASATSASAKTAVYWGGAGGGGFSSFSGAIESGASDSLTGDGLLRRRLAVDDRARLRGVPLLHALEAALLGGLEALALDGVDVDDDRAVGLERVADRAPQRGDVVAVDDPDVGEVELLEEQAGRPVGLDRGLDLRAEPLDAPRRARAAACVRRSSTSSRAW